MPILPRRNSDGMFDSPGDAYEWAVTILQLKRGAKERNYIPNVGGGGSKRDEERRLDAIQILGVIEQHDISENGRISFFADYFLPIPTEPAPPFTIHEMTRLMRRVNEFSCELALLGFLNHCGKRKCKKKIDRRKRVK